MNKKNVLLIVISFVVFAVFMTVASAVGSGGGSDNSGSTSISSSSSASALYDNGVQAGKGGDYQTALKYFEQANGIDKNNPDILNMLGKIDEALATYAKALSLRHNFPEAREYLGEAYIQAALKQLDILNGYGNAGVDSRNFLIKAMKDALSGIK
jgi:tetratricopeptide (TPR) repeat protein